MTYSVRQLLLYVAVFGSLLGLGTKVYFEDWGVSFARSSGLSTAQGSEYRWDAAHFVGSLRYAVISPMGPYFRSMRIGRGPIVKAIHLRPDGIYLHGQPMPMTARIYIDTAAGILQPIDLTEEEVDDIGIKPNTESKAWQEKVEPLIDAEYQLGRAAIRQAVEEDLERRRAARQQASP
jgi:hypothetical protein